MRSFGGYRWVALLVLAVSYAAALKPLDRDRWFAMTPNLLVKAGEDGTMERDSIELPLEVPSANSVCGRKGRAYLDQLIQRGGSGKSDMQKTLSDKISNHPKRKSGPCRIREDYLSMKMISRGFAWPDPNCSSDCEKHQKAAEIARERGVGCVNDPASWSAKHSRSDKKAGGVARSSEENRTPSLENTSVERQFLLEPDLQLPSGFQWRLYSEGLADMVDFFFLDDGNMVVMRVNGIMHHVSPDGRTRSTPFFDFRDITNDYFDRGAISVIRAPDYSRTHHIYFYFTYEHDPRIAVYETAKTARVVRARVSDDETTVIRSSMEVIIGSVTGEGCDLSLGLDCISVDSRSHSGGGMTFADGHLFIAIGDMAKALLTAGGHRSQQPGHYTGKVLRINPNTGRGLTTNPYYTPGMSLDNPSSKIYSFGARSPNTLESTAGSEPVVVGDVQWETEEKVSPVISGRNLGWPCWEANVFRADYLRYEECRNFRNETRVEPLLAWGRKPGTTSAAVVGEHISPVGWPDLYRNVRVFGDFAARAMGFAKVNADGSLRDLVQTVSIRGSPLKFRMDPTNRKLIVLEHWQKKIQELSFDKYFNDISVLQTVPEAGATVPVTGAEFLIKFSVNPLPESVPRKVYLRRADGGAVVRSTVTLDFPMSTVSVKPNSALIAGQGYEIIVVKGDNGVRNLFGERMQGDNKFYFTAAGAVADTEPPRVLWVGPGRGAKLVSVTHRFQVRLSEAIITPLDTSVFTVVRRRSGGITNPVPLTNFQYNAVSRTVSFDSLDPLLFRNCYYIRVSNRLEDRAGNRMVSSWQSGFCTERPDPNAITGRIRTPGLKWSGGQAFARVNQRLSISGEMTTVDGVSVPPENLRFQFIINHCAEGVTGCHQHVVHSMTGDALFPITCPDHTGSFDYTVRMSASFAGYTGEKIRRIAIIRTPVTFRSEPNGKEVSVNGVSRTTPFTLDMAVDSENYLFAPPVQGTNFRLWRHSTSSGVVTDREPGVEFYPSNNPSTWTAVYAS